MNINFNKIRADMEAAKSSLVYARSQREGNPTPENSKREADAFNHYAQMAKILSAADDVKTATDRLRMYGPQYLEEVE